VASYHIWHPSYPLESPRTLELFVTLGDAFFLAHGSDELVAAALAALGIRSRPKSWSFQAMRSHYFSSYRGQGAWEDDWALVWRLRAELPDTPPLPPPRTWGYFDLETIDQSFNRADPPDKWQSWPALVLADVPDDEALEGVRSLLLERCLTAEIATGRAYARVPQLRCILGDRHRAFYEAGATEAESLLTSMVDLGASVRFDETLDLLSTWQA
jgi:hypothetical protein